MLSRPLSQDDQMQAMAEEEDQQQQQSPPPQPMDPTLAALSQIQSGLMSWPLMNAKEYPIRGMNSYANPTAVDGGFYTFIQNLRAYGGIIRCRDGISEYTGQTGLPAHAAGIFRGATYWNSNFYAAYANAGKIDLYKSPDLVAWTLLTQSANAMQNDGTAGDNRMADSGDVKFIPVTNQWFFDGSNGYQKAIQDFLLVGCGGNGVRVLNGQDGSGLPGYATYSRVAVHRAVSPPSGISTQRSYSGFRSNFIVRLGNFTLSASDGLPSDTHHLDIIKAGASSGYYYPEVQANTDTVTNDWCEVTFPSPIAIGNPVSPQLLMVAYDADGDFLDHVRVHVISGATDVVIYDPSNGDDRVEIPFAGLDTPDTQNPYSQLLAVSPAGFPTVTLPPYQNDVREEGVLKLIGLWTGNAMNTLPNTFDTIRFEWIDQSSPLGQKNFKIFAAGASGFWQGGSQYAATLLNSASGAESPGVVIPPGGGQTINSLGGPFNESYRIPDVPEIYYQPAVPFQCSTTQEFTRGVDLACFYIRRYGEDMYHQIGGSQGRAILGTFDGVNWNLNTASYPLIANNEVLYNNLEFNNGVDISRELPDELHNPINPFTMAETVGGRLVCGRNQTLQVSDSQDPFRHRSFPRFDPAGNLDISTPTEYLFHGESLSNATSVSASIYGAAQALVWTDKGAYSIDTANPLSGTSFIGPTGMVSPRSLATFKGSAWFLDDQRQMRSFEDSRINDLTKGVIEDWFGPPSKNWDGIYRGINGGRIQHVASQWFNDKLYVAFTPCDPSTGATPATPYNTSVLVYDSRVGGWFYDLPASGFSCEKWVVWNNVITGNYSLVAFGNDGRIFGYEMIGHADDFGTAIPIEIDFPPLVSYFRVHFRIIFTVFDPVTIYRCGVVCDALNGGTLTLNRVIRSRDNYAAKDGTVTSTIPLDASGTSIWRWTETAGARGVFAALKLSSTVPARWALHSLVIETDMPGGAGADAK